MKKKTSPQVQPIQAPVLPAPYRKVWEINNNIVFTWRERLAILFRGQALIRTRMMSERMPGRMEGRIMGVKITGIAKGKFENVGASEPERLKGNDVKNSR